MKQLSPGVVATSVSIQFYRGRAEAEAFLAKRSKRRLFLVSAASIDRFSDAVRAMGKSLEGAAVATTEAFESIEFPTRYLREFKGEWHD